jgi:hypothetical protein
MLRLGRMLSILERSTLCRLYNMDFLTMHNYHYGSRYLLEIVHRLLRQKYMYIVYFGIRESLVTQYITATQSDSFDVG